jgi:proline dehydrogenase
MLANYLPTNLILYLAAPYLAGETAEEALAKARDLWQEFKFASTMDVLGEQSTSVEQCQLYEQTFKDLISHVACNPLPIDCAQKQITISFKPSMFYISGTSGTPSSIKGFDDALQRMANILDLALKHNVQMTLEAEDHHWTDFHLESYFSLLNAGYSNLGTVLQSRLFRTAQDIKRFNERTRVRLVTGIYMENERIAYTSNKPIKEALISYSRELMQNGVYVEMASHDQIYLQRFFSQVVLPLQAKADQFETQFLLGVPRLKLQKQLTSGEYFKQWHDASFTDAQRAHLESLSQSGTVVRLYLPFGSGAVASPYCKRRLEHNPNLFIYGLKNLLHL